MDNSDVAILESSVDLEETSVVSNGFKIAPPAICEKWVRTSSQSLNRSITTDLVPLPAMASESILKITEVKSLSPLKNNQSPMTAQLSRQDRINPKTSAKRKLQHSSPTECITLDLDDDCDEKKSPSAFCKKLKLETFSKRVSFNEQVDSSDNAQNEDCEVSNRICVGEINGKNGKDPTVQPKKRVKPITIVKGKMCTTIEDFIKVCTDVAQKAEEDKGEGMKRILNNKVLKHYGSADKVFIASQSFQKLLARLIANVKSDETNMYVPVKELVDELKARKASNYEPPKKKQKQESDEPPEIDYEVIDDKRTQRKILKLSKTLTILKTKIKELEEQELGLDELENEDSAYIMLQRYKERALKVFKKLCEYTKESKSAGRSNKISFSGTPYLEVNRCIRAFVNETGEFPDYVDILNVIKKVNSETSLITSEEKLKAIARDAFTKVGEELQKVRKLGLAESLQTFINDNSGDPADESEELQAQLKANKANWLKLNEIIDDYATRETKPKEAANEEKEEEEETDNEEEEEEDDEDQSEEISEVDSNISDTEIVDSAEIDKVEAEGGNNVTEIEDLTNALETEVCESEVQGAIEKGAEVKIEENQISKACLVSSDLVESTAEEVEKTIIKSEPSDGNIFKIRVRSAESLGGTSFSNLKASSDQVPRSDSDDVILLD